jgi:hypothetical protein
MKTFFRLRLSTSLVFFFFLILLFLGLFAEVFESRAPEVDLAQIYANPVQVQELQRLKSLRLSNKHGNFIFENTHPDGHLSGPWQMVKPHTLRVKPNAIGKIIEALNVIRVRNFHRHEPINITSFSLDNPTLTLNFNNWNNKLYEIKMGLINPIDNSAYLTISSQDQIYQIDPLELTLESYDLTQMVENKILALNMDSLSSVEFYGQDSNALLKLVMKDQQWFDQNNTILDASKIKRFLERMEEIKSSSILEDLTSEQQSFLNKVSASPAFTLKIISNQGVRSYLFSEMKSGTSSVGLPKETLGSFVMTSEDRDSFVLIETDQLKVFQTSLKELK